jgi:transposase
VVFLAWGHPICYRITVSDTALSPLDKDARIAELEAALAVRDTLIETLRFQLSQLRRMSFGQSSEKLSLQIEQLELTLEELEGEAEVADARKPTEPAQPDRTSPVRTLPTHLPRDERRIEPEAGNCTCPDCGGVLRSLAEDSDEMLDVAPVQWRVIRTVRPKYSCRSCEKIVQAPAPVKAIARGKASFATLAHVVVAKWDHHLPLYRQAEMMAAQGVDIDRSTLAGWAGQAAHLLDPIVTRIREEGLKATKLHTDDTPVPMLVPGPRADARRFNKQPDCVRRGKAAQARLWAYVVDDRASGATGPALVWYKFTPDRGGIHPQAELKTFTGLLQADGYAGYEKLYAGGKISEVACWAHFRRKIFENHQTSPTPLTTDLLGRVSRPSRQWPRRLPMDANAGMRSPVSSTKAAPRSTTTSPNAPCAASQSAVKIGCSPVQRWAASAPPPSIPSSRPPSSTALSRRPTSPMSSKRSPAVGPHHAGTNARTHFVGGSLGVG